MEWIAACISLTIIVLQVWVMRSSERSMKQWRSLVDDMQRQTDELIAAVDAHGGENVG